VELHNLEMSRALLKSVAEANPDLVYAMDGGGDCMYYPQQQFSDEQLNTGYNPKAEIQLQTGCIVGACYHEKTGEWPMDWDGGFVNLATGVSSAGTEEVPFTEMAAHYLEIAQIKQDLGETWGKAYEAAEKWLVEYLKGSDTSDVLRGWSTKAKATTAKPFDDTMLASEARRIGATQ
jgi:hypothetical protein